MNFEIAVLKKQRKLAVIWAVTFLIVFPLLVTLGLLMRMNQGQVATVEASNFYSFMTLHGLGMVGVLFSVAFAGIWYIIATRYAKLSLGIGYFFYIFSLLGVLGLAASTLIGKFAAGWYLLYPLPFQVGATWQVGSTQLITISIIVLGVGWLVGMTHVVTRLAKTYGGFANMMGWQYLSKKRPRTEIDPIIMITPICLIPGIVSTLVGAAMLVMFMIQTIEPSITYDALLMKNMVMFFGHTVANITMYICVGWVYTLLPEFTNRPWKTDKILVLSWNATFFFIVFAFFHHMYYDFSQPMALQYIGQFASYFSAVPATAITMVGVIAQLYRAKIKWSVIPLTFFLGTAGWAIGGFSAVVDSTIAINKGLHNTLWVPAHFHTYLLMGVVVFILGFLFYLFTPKDNKNAGPLSKFGFWLYTIGGYGFVLMFYLGGAHSVPRRYADYKGITVEATKTIGTKLAATSVLFISLVLAGLLIMYISLFINLAKRKRLQTKPTTITEPEKVMA